MYITNENCKVPGVLGKLGILILVLLLVFPLFSQVKKAEQPLRMEEYPLKIWIISRFLDFVKWPPGSETNQGSGQFVVGIIGNTAMLEFKKIFHEKIRLPGKTLIIKKCTDPEEIEGCHVLIIGGSESNRLAGILAITENKPVLSIGDTGGFGKKGVLINLYKSGRKVKFEINFTAVQKSGLIFSSKLYKLARIIK